MRFILIENDPKFPADEETCWYWDTSRPLKGSQPYVAVQVEQGKNPNEFKYVEGLRLLFTDQAEYHAVCPSCYSIYSHMQWSGSTQSRGWREASQRYLEQHQKVKGWCEFCDPVFGNGGWALDESFF